MSYQDVRGFYEDYEPDQPPSAKEIREWWNSSADEYLRDRPYPDAGVQGALMLAEKVIGNLEKQIADLTDELNEKEPDYAEMDRLRAVEVAARELMDVIDTGHLHQRLSVLEEAENKLRPLVSHHAPPAAVESDTDLPLWECVAGHGAHTVIRRGASAAAVRAFLASSNGWQEIPGDAWQITPLRARPEATDG